MSNDTVGSKAIQEIEQFMKEWPAGREEIKARVEFFLNYLKKMDGVRFNFSSRPGVSYSIRPVRAEQEKRGRALFAMIDVIDDEPEQRWLSVCFYGDMITDPEERGEVIPGGLGGDDGYCFDMFEDDPELGEYLLSRLDEANMAAKK